MLWWFLFGFLMMAILGLLWLQHRYHLLWRNEWQRFYVGHQSSSATPATQQETSTSVEPGRTVAPLRQAVADAMVLETLPTQAEFVASPEDVPQRQPEAWRQAVASQSSSSVLANPDADLETITVDEISNRINLTSTSKNKAPLQEIKKQDIYRRLARRPSLKVKRYGAMMPSPVHETNPQASQLSKTTSAAVAPEIISVEDIRSNLLRRRLARNPDNQAKSTPVVHKVIGADEVIANLAHTDAPARRYYQHREREVVRDSIIPVAARINGTHAFAADVAEAPVSENRPLFQRFTPYVNPPTESETASSWQDWDPKNNATDTDAADAWSIPTVKNRLMPHKDQASAVALDEIMAAEDHFHPPHQHQDQGISWQTVADDAVEEIAEPEEAWARYLKQPIQTNLNERDADVLRDSLTGDQATANINAQDRAEKKTLPLRHFSPRSAVTNNASSHGLFPSSGYEEDFPLPSLALLAPAHKGHTHLQSDEELLERSVTIEEKLAEFRVKVRVVNAYAGPVITRFDIEPDTGVRGNQVLNLEKDLARALGCAAIRIVETIPGKTCMGLEVPNPQRQMIRLSEILGDEVFLQSASRLTIALGQDITGRPVVTDLATAPHLLVAGATGSGKSVGINAIILSMLYKATPEEVRMIMIDPKMLELSIYEGIPHLLTPVVTDMRLAANALTWCVNEMDRRYRLMSHLGVRNLAGYNARIDEAQKARHFLADPFSLDSENPLALEKLPAIVVVVDEFSELMMIAGKKTEELIARLAQKARAAGIHLILATQRPSVDVITGLIKANIPTRISFQVFSKVDSRTILDQTGAENLLGQGDMLFAPRSGYLERVHGAFVADDEVHRVADYLRSLGSPDYVDDVVAPESSNEDGLDDDEENDPLYDEAVALVIKSRRATISSIQRQLRIGYNRAARMIEQMENAGIVSAAESNGMRTVLVPEREPR